MKLLLIVLLLPSCAGYSYKPSISYEDEAGHKVSASMAIYAPKNPSKVSK